MNVDIFHHRSSSQKKWPAVVVDVIISTVIISNVSFNAVAGVPLFQSALGSAEIGLPKLPQSGRIDFHSPAAPIVRLGERLFYEPRLSADGKHSCASCHQPDRYFSDGMPVSIGVFGRKGTRNAPSLLNSVFNSSQFWDGRVTTLEQQASNPLVNPREMALDHIESIVPIVSADTSYLPLFAAAFGEQPSHLVTVDNITKALAAFERSLVAADSPFDRYSFGGDKSALSASAVRGYSLFVGAAKCAECHTVTEHDALFTDNNFHALSIGMRRIGPQLSKLATTLSVEKMRGTPLDKIILTNDDFAELGRFAVTLQPQDIGTFRTPSLRNVALTGPYMHDGSVPTLEGAVDLEVYYRSNQQGRSLLLTPLERQDLIDFLKSLTSSASAIKRLAPTGINAEVFATSERANSLSTHVDSMPLPASNAITPFTHVDQSY